VPSNPKITKYGAYSTSTKGKISNEIYSLKIVAPRRRMRKSDKLFTRNTIRNNLHVNTPANARMKVINIKKR